MQTEDPVLHKVYDWLAVILLKIYGRIAKPESIARIFRITEWLFGDTNMLEIGQISLSREIIQALEGCTDAAKAKLNILKPESGDNFLELCKNLPFHISSTLIDEWTY